MSLTVLIASLCLPFAALISIVWLQHARSRAAAGRFRIAQSEAAEELSYLQACVEASRESSWAVLRHLECALREVDPGVDAFAAFVPEGDALRCTFTAGARAEHFIRMLLARNAHDELPARAAALGHRVALGPGVRALMPTDRHAIALPLTDDTGLHAVVYASSSREGAFDQAERLIRVMFNAGPAYILACERETDRADATYDALTGLLTPRAFRNRLHAELLETRHRPGMTASLWFIDTDNFKRVNDGFGHAAGDVVLQGMADVLRAHTFVELDIAGRNGGDEFCALIRESQKTVAIERAHALCVAIREREFGIPVKISASIGVATFPHDARSSSELLEVADAAMYHSKRQGRDRVSFALDGDTFAVYR